MNECPNFWTVFAEALGLSAARRGLLAYIPWWLLLCCAVPVLTIFLLSHSLRSQITDSNATTVFTGIAVVEGFFGSVSVRLLARFRG